MSTPTPPAPRDPSAPDATRRTGRPGLLGRPLVRWAVPATVAVVLAGGGSVVGLVSAQAGERLAPVTAAQLLAEVQQAKVPGITGTVVQRADLGLPSLPGAGGEGDSSQLSSLVSGTHELRVWSRGEDQSRVALTGTLGESDVVRDGRTVWVWSSKDKTATRWTLPTRTSDRRTPGDTTTTPQQAAEQALEAITPTTKVSTDGTATVAGRRAYELVLQPRQAGSLVGSVRLAVDGETHVPLRVQIFAAGASDPALEVGYTSFSPEAPAASVFEFTPPPGAKVTEKSPGAVARKDPSTTPGTPSPKVEKPQVSGTGWATVVVGKIPPQLVLEALSGAKADSSSQKGKGNDANGLAGVLQALPRVSGDWGSGRLLRGTLFSAVLTDDGRVALGAVAPEQLYAALARR